MGDVIIMQVIGIVRIELMRKLIVLKIIALNKVLVCSVDTFLIPKNFNMWQAGT